MIYFCILACLLVSGCSFREFYPTAGAIIGGGAGSVAGPIGGALGAGSGALVGEKFKGNSELKEAKETITQITQGDVEGLIKNQMGEHQSAFDSFVSTIKRILTGAAILLGCYLAIPIFVARKCSKSEAQKHLTRPPFPTK